MIELTLTTLMVALSVGVFLTTVDFTSNALDRATRRLESDLRYAQQTAAAEESNCGMITTGANSYSIYCQNPGNLITDPHTQQALSIDFNTGYDGVAFGGAYQIEFDTLGRPSIGGGTQCQLSLGNQTRTVTIVATTGYIQVQ